MIPTSPSGTARRLNRSPGVGLELWHEPDRAVIPAERVLRARIAAYSLHSTHDSREITASARRAFLDRFVREVDPDEVLPTVERARRAQAAKKAYFTRLALKSAQARRGQRRGPE